jgi:hypothetical protein
MRLTVYTPILAIVFLASCSSPFRDEAGNMDSGDFGNATMQNTLTSTGKMLPPMGNDKYDAAYAGQKISGKYMATTATSYITSAERSHPNNSAISTQIGAASGQ